MADNLTLHRCRQEKPYKDPGRQTAGDTKSESRNGRGPVQETWKTGKDPGIDGRASPETPVAPRSCQTMLVQIMSLKPCRLELAEQALVRSSGVFDYYDIMIGSFAYLHIDTDYKRRL
jgi:hypothetical protein